jgi:hypothetical protein
VRPIVRARHLGGRNPHDTDDLSRVDLSNGVMVGKSMLDFVPLNKTAFDRSPSLKAWFGEWTKGLNGFEFLNHEDWFTRAHKDGLFLWSPIPAAVDVALELL